MLKMFFTGRLASDPKTATTKSGRQVCNFDLAVKNVKWRDETGAGKNEDRQFYMGVAAWDSLGSLCAQYLVKGREVTVVASGLSLSTYKSEKYGDIRIRADTTANDVEFGSKYAAKAEDGEGEGQHEKKPRGAGKKQDADAVPEGFVAVDDSELPF